jgi:hypothetical protein
LQWSSTQSKTYAIRGKEIEKCTSPAGEDIFSSHGKAKSRKDLVDLIMALLIDHNQFWIDLLRRRFVVINQIGNTVIHCTMLNEFSIEPSQIRERK